MRIVVGVAISVALSASASAQTPAATIRTDVPHDEAVLCLSLRGLQMQMQRRADVVDPQVRAGFMAWSAHLESKPGYRAMNLEAMEKRKSENAAAVKRIESAPGFQEDPHKAIATLAANCLMLEMASDS